MNYVDTNNTITSIIKAVQSVSIEFMVYYLVHIYNRLTCLSLTLMSISVRPGIPGAGNVILGIKPNLRIPGPDPD